VSRVINHCESKAYIIHECMHALGCRALFHRSLESGQPDNKGPEATGKTAKTGASSSLPFTFYKLAQISHNFRPLQLPHYMLQHAVSNQALQRCTTTDIQQSMSHHTANSAIMKPGESLDWSAPSSSQASVDTAESNVYTSKMLSYSPTLHLHTSH
jgi:hypothetical protein